LKLCDSSAGVALPVFGTIVESLFTDNILALQFLIELQKYQKAISELPCGSVSKQVLVQNVLREN